MALKRDRLGQLEIKGRTPGAALRQYRCRRRVNAMTTSGNPLPKQSRPSLTCDLGMACQDESFLQHLLLSTHFEAVASHPAHPGLRPTTTEAAPRTLPQVGSFDAQHDTSIATLVDLHDLSMAQSAHLAELGVHVDEPGISDAM